MCSLSVFCGQTKHSRIHSPPPRVFQWEMRGLIYIVACFLVTRQVINGFRIWKKAIYLTSPCGATIICYTTLHQPHKLKALSSSIFFSKPFSCGILSVTVSQYLSSSVIPCSLLVRYSFCTVLPPGRRILTPPVLSRRRVLIRPIVYCPYYPSWQTNP
jgi:hypothetical protein